MKNSAVLINVGRGPIVNEEDLAEALEKGEIAAAGLDVISVEPIRADNPADADSRQRKISDHTTYCMGKH